MKTHHCSVCVGVLLVCLVLCGPVIRAATLTVTSSADGGAGALRQAVSNSVSGDTIVFAAGLSGQTIVLTNGNIVLRSNLTIDASSLVGGIQISGNDLFQVFLVESAASVTLKSLTLRNARGGGDDGGALRNAGTVTMDRCTFTDNSTGSGGAIKNDIGATMTLTQCTLSGNASSPYGGGGAIVNYSILNLLHCTMAGNWSGGFGGGIFNDSRGGDITLVNTIVAGNASPDIYNTSVLRFSGPNIVQSYFGTTYGPAPISAEPQLAPLGNYGGATPTRPPLPGSPAVDAGDDASVVGLATDQRGAGFPRVSGDHVDIGAVERQLIAANTYARLRSLAPLGNGAYQFGFTNQPGASFRVLASTNVSFPGSNWTWIGFATETTEGSGQFQFTDQQATNHPLRFYRVRSP
jgi:hypothetical protein